MQTVMLQSMSVRPTARFTATRPATGNSRAMRLVAPAGKAKDMGDGVLPGIASWPPKPITEHGQPKPEDDPANFAGSDIVNLKRVGGPSDEEVAAKKEEGRKNSPFQPGGEREGGTQAGGGGEGSAS